MDNNSRTVKCGTHGNVGIAFVCCHVASERDRRLGFYEVTPDEESPEPQGWCASCEERLIQAGHWTDEHAEVLVVVCEFCFDTIKRHHQEPPNNSFKPMPLRGTP